MLVRIEYTSTTRSGTAFTTSLYFSVPELFTTLEAETFRYMAPKACSLEEIVTALTRFTYFTNTYQHAKLNTKSILQYGVQRFAEDMWPVLSPDSNDSLTLFFLSKLGRKCKIHGREYTLCGLLHPGVAEVQYIILDDSSEHTMVDRDWMADALWPKLPQALDDTEDWTPSVYST